MNQRNPGLDILRLAACLLVICHHFEVLWPAEHGAWLHDITHYLKRFGRAGVPLFFVLSGYLISTLLFAEQDRAGRISVGRFYIRRGFKIYPAFWVLVVVTIGVLLALREPWTWRNLVVELLFVQNYFVGMWGHTWTLAVEEHFYIALPLLLLALRRLDKPDGPPFAWLPLCFVIIATGCLAARYMAFSREPFQLMPSIFYTHLQMDSLLFGVLISWLLHHGSLRPLVDRIPSWLLVIGGWALLHPDYMSAGKENWWMPVIGPLSFFFGAGLLLLAALRIRSSNSKAVHLLAYLGSCSYGIYLWHLLVNGFGMRVFARLTGLRDPRIYIIVYPLAALLAGWLSLVLIEQPCLRLRDRWFPSRAREEK